MLACLGSKRMLKKRSVVIDGRQLTGNIGGGVQRYISEILFELDKLVKPGEYEILIPKKTNIVCEYKNIKIVNYGRLRGLLWEQICLPFYLWKNKLYGVFPCTIVPLLYPKGIVVLHDVMIASRPELGDSFSNPLAKKLLLANYRIAARHADAVCTVSENSRKDISEIYGKDLDDIHVIGNAWQHMERVQMDDSWRKKYPQLKEGKYYFSLSANRKQKNFKWIYEMAIRNPNVIFAMAGTREEWQRVQEYEAPNIIHLGFVSDGEVKSLMHHCKAFLFPSFYEGFGIPPMEALSAGAKIVIANSSCLPEIYRDSAYYIDPYSYDINLEELLKNKVAPAENVLNRYSWKISACKLNEICKNIAVGL